jgi:hypothetical protein
MEPVDASSEPPAGDRCPGDCVVKESTPESIAPLPPHLEAIRARLEAAWQAATPSATLPRIEDHLAGVTEGERLALLRELVAGGGEGVGCADGGRRPSPSSGTPRGSAAWRSPPTANASGSWDQTVKVWDAHTGQETLTLKGHTDRVRSVAFSGDGQRIASGSYDGTVKVWDAQRDEQEEKAQPPTPRK